MLVIFAVTALVKVYGSNAPATVIKPALSWFNPMHIGSFTTFSQGIVLMLFIYWGWDSAVSVNEETKDRDKTPGRAAVISTVLLLVTYVIVTLAAQSFAGVGDKGIGLGNPDNSGDIFSVVGGAVFGSARLRGGHGQVADRPRADVRRGQHADDDPAHCSHDAVHGGVQRDPVAVRAGSTVAT